MSRTALVDELLDLFTLCLDEITARRLAEFTIPIHVQTKVHALAERANEGALSPTELAEYESVINAADFVQMISQRAARSLDSH